MRLTLDPEGVAGYLPDGDSIVDDPRLRPIGLVGGLTALTLAVLLQLQPLEQFWSAVVGGVLAFIGVPVLALGLAAPEPAADRGLFHIGVDLNWIERRVVAAGALCVLVSPMLVAAVGPAVGFADWLWLLAAGLAFVGAVLMLTGFVAWSSKAIAQPARPH